MTVVEFYKALADDTRLRMLLMLIREGELCVCELTEALQLSQPKISRHLAQLRNTGLLQDRREGQWVFYRIHQQLPKWSEQVLRETLMANSDYLTDNIQHLQRMGNRPERTSRCCQ